MTEDRPFHETILDAIREACSAEGSVRLVDGLASLIKSTKIPKGHEAIVAEWKGLLDWYGWNDNPFGVVESVLRKKQEAEAEAQRKAQAQEQLGRDLSQTTAVF